MTAEVILTRRTIPQALEEFEASRSAVSVAVGVSGAVVEFRGLVRNREFGPGNPDGSFIKALEYEAHEPMAAHQCRLILERLGEAFPLESMLVIHRIGTVPVGEASILVRVVSGHRAEALAACAEFLDELKRWVPIWKMPVY